jgi:putative endonuclease
MKTTRRELGDLGETAAVSYLKRLGYKIIETNYLIPGLGEIDIIAIDPDKALVFIEVKTMNNVSRETLDTLSPEDQLTKSKLRKMRNAAQVFHVKHSHLVKKAGFRIDAISIGVLNSSSGAFSKNNLFKFNDKILGIHHYKNVA